MLSKILHEMEDSGYGEVRRDYSGRGMYGATCIGFVSDLSAMVIAKKLVQFGGAEFVESAREDSMGLATIYYWPDVKAD